MLNRRYRPPGERRSLDKAMNCLVPKPIEKPLVSIIVAAYNEQSCVGPCLASLKSQTLAPLEIIVVDDGSTDWTVEVCLDHGVQMHRQRHRGPGAARNLGGRVARGNILALLDADMTFDRNYLKALVDPILRGEAIATIGWDEYVANWESAWARCECRYANLPERRRLPLAAPDGSEVYRAVRRDFFLEAGGFDEDKGRSDDHSLFRRTGVRAQVVQGAVCYHHNASSASEVFHDAAWAGKDILLRGLPKRGVLKHLWQQNPLRAVPKSIVRGVTHWEPLLPVYGLIYSLGFNHGFFYGLVTARFSK